jgi:HD superfamily phosphohydrolase YqeK
MTDAATASDAATAPALARLHAWFASYCGSFRSADAEVQRNFDLKELHTRKVCEAACLIARGGSPRRQLLAEVAALCHDLGRFPQFRDYHTFKDSESLNHAHLSAQILKQSDMLDFLSDSERASVLDAVRLHNVYQVPPGLTAEADDLLRLLRDADKIDIWRVFVEHFETPEDERASGVTLGFPDLPFCSPEVLATVGDGRLVQLSTMKSVNDFKLLQLSWVYDVNFTASLRLIRERRLLERLAATLPGEEAVVEVVSRVQSYLKRRLADS